MIRTWSDGPWTVLPSLNADLLYRIGQDAGGHWHSLRFRWSRYLGLYVEGRDHNGNWFTVRTHVR